MCCVGRSGRRSSWLRAARGLVLVGGGPPGMGRGVGAVVVLGGRGDAMVWFQRQHELARQRRRWARKVVGVVVEADESQSGRSMMQIS